MSMTVIEHIEVGSGGAASITFSAIPDTYTDLLILVSARNGDSVRERSGLLQFNGSGSGFSGRTLGGDGSSAFSEIRNGWFGRVPGANNTSNTFGSSSIYIPNYRSSANKSISTDDVFENNGTTALQGIFAQLWSNTSPITSVTLTMDAGNFVQYSSASLFGITAGSDGTTTVS